MAALATDRRWAAVAAAPTRALGAGALGTTPEPTNLLTQRDSFAWGNKPVPPASNAWGLSSLLSLKNDEGSGPLTYINVRPASGGSSGSSTSGSDLLDSPLAWGRNSDPASASNVLTLHNSGIAISRSQRTDSRSGSVQLSHFRTSFSEALKAPLRSTAKQGPISHGKGFTLSADDFPVLVFKISESKSQQDDPVPNTNLPIEAQKAPNICMPPPWPDHWNPPPDHPPDRNRIWHRGAASYGPRKPGNTPGTGILPAESLIHNGQTLLHQEGEARHDPVHGGHHPENRDSCYALVPTDACVKSLPHLIPGKVKDSHSDTLGKQPVIKKDLVLLEKIRLLNIKARILRAQNMSEISSRRESKAEHPKSSDVKADQVAKDIPFRAVTNDIAAAFDLANLVSECPNLVLNGPSNVPPDSVIVDLSGGHITESSEDRKLGKSADYHVQKAKSMAKSEEVNSHSYAHSHKSYNAQIEANKILCKQKAGGSGTAEHDTSTSDTCFIDYAENLNVPLTANGVKNATVSISSTAPSDTAGVTRGPLIHSITPSANKTDRNMAERISQKSAAQSNGTIVRKLLLMESRQRQVHSQDRILRERSNIAESTEHNRNVARTLMDTRRSEDKPRVDLSTRNENRRPVPPHVFYPENTEASSVHKNRTSGVVINSSIIPKQVASVRGFTVGSIMLGDVSLPSVNREEKTVVKKVHGTINGCESPQQTEQSGKDNYGVQLARDAHGNDSVMHTPVKEPSKKNQSEIGMLNGTTIPAPTLSSRGHNIVWGNVEPTKMSKMEKPACEEQHFQNLGKIAMVESHATSYHTSKLEGERHGKEALDTSTITKNEVQTEAGNCKVRVPEKKIRPDNEASKHSSRIPTSGNKVSTNGLAAVGPKITGADSLLLNVSQELSDMSQQVESKTHVATEYSAQPTRAVFFPDNSREMHLAGGNQRWYHVEGQEYLQNTYANYIGISGTMHGFRNGTPLSQSFSRPQVDALVNGVPGWTWDLNEGILVSDMDNFQGLGTATVDRSSAELTHNDFSSGAVDLHGGQVVGDMVFEAANPGIQHHTCLEHQHLSPAWHLPAQHDGMHHGGGSTGVYWPNMERDTGMEAHSANRTARPMEGLRQVEYQVEPVASSGAAYDWSPVEYQVEPVASWSQGHQGSNLTTPHWE